MHRNMYACFFIIKDHEKIFIFPVNWQVKEFTNGYGGKIRGEFYDPFQRVSHMMKELDEVKL
jgi:hypothetical protein